MQIGKLLNQFYIFIITFGLINYTYNFLTLFFYLTIERLFDFILLKYCDLESYKLNITNKIRGDHKELWDDHKKRPILLCNLVQNSILFYFKKPF